jgi:hypothetical protein
VKCAVISANFGGFDPVFPHPPQSTQADFFLFSDKPIPDADAKGWKNLVVPFPRGELSNRMRAKYFKLQHHRIPELKDYGMFIWVDAAIEMTSKDYVIKMLQPAKEGLNCFIHPDRKCIYAEAETLQKHFPKKIEGERLAEQIAEYRRIGHPENFGLCVMTHFVHIPTAESKRVFDEWWMETIKWTARDQVSFPIICTRFKYSPWLIPGNPYNPNLLKWHSHHNV